MSQVKSPLRSNENFLCHVQIIWAMNKGNSYSKYGKLNTNLWLILLSVSLWVTQWISVDIVTVLSIQPKLSKIWKQQQMVQKFRGKFSSNSRNFWISKMWIFQPKILEILGEKFNWKKTSGKNFWKFGYTSQGCPIFGNLWKCCSILYWKLTKKWVESTLR